MSTRPATILAVLGCLCFSPLAADELTDGRGNVLYGKITGFSADGVVFQQNCTGEAQTFGWSGLVEARFSGDCSAAKSWRGGGPIFCEGIGLQWIEQPGLVDLEERSETLKEGEVPGVGMAAVLLGLDANSVRYIDVCTGAEKTIPTGDLVLTPTPGYCSTECQ